MQKFSAILSAPILLLFLVGSKNQTCLGSHAEPAIIPEKRVYHTLVYHDELKKTILLDGYHRPDGTP